MKKHIIFTMIAATLVLTACDAQIGKIASLGENAKVECWSGGQLIYDGKSTGKVLSESRSDGYFFKDEKTGKFMEVSGNCVITYDP